MRPTTVAVMKRFATAALALAILLGPTMTGWASPADDAALLDQLAVVADDTRAPTKYDRKTFGTWPQTRHGVQTDDAVRDDAFYQETWDEDGQTITHAFVDDPYSGSTIEWERGHSGAVDVDHIIALSRAWHLGAWRWDRTLRTEFANDLDNLVAVSASENRAKGDKGPGEWMVPNNPGYRCEYAHRYIHVAAKYELPISTTDQLVLEDTLVQCAQTAKPSPLQDRPGLPPSGV